MNAAKSASMFFAPILALATILPAARAGEFNQAKKFVFSHSIEVPRTILPSGAYWIMRANRGANPDVVQILDSDRSELYATVTTIPRERLTPTGETVGGISTRESDNSAVLTEWFYPGFTIGHEFAYPPDEARELEQGPETIVKTLPSDSRSIVQVAGIGD